MPNDTSVISLDRLSKASKDMAVESLVNSYISLVFTHDNMTNIQTLLCRSFCMSLEAEVLISPNRQTVKPSRQTLVYM